MGKKIRVRKKAPVLELSKDELAILDIYKQAYKRTSEDDRLTEKLGRPEKTEER